MGALLTLPHHHGGTYSDAPPIVSFLPELQLKVSQPLDKKFYLFKVLRAHILPLTNVAFNKSGSR